jgi:hypothetical protein
VKGFCLVYVCINTALTSTVLTSLSTMELTVSIFLDFAVQDGKAHPSTSQLKDGYFWRMDL